MYELTVERKLQLVVVNHNFGAWLLQPNDHLHKGTPNRVVSCNPTKLQVRVTHVLIIGWLLIIQV